MPFEAPDTFTRSPGENASNGHDLTHQELPRLVAEFPDHAVRGRVGLLEVAELRLGERLLLAGTERELHGFVTVTLDGPDRRDRAGAGLENSYSLDPAVLAEALRHTELFGQDRRHRQLGGQANLDVHAGGEMIKTLERVHGLGRRLVDIDQSLMGADLKMLTRILVLER